MGFLGIKDKFDKALDERKAYLVQLGLDQRRIDDFVLEGKKLIKQYKSEGLDVVSSALDAFKFVEVKYNDFQSVGFTEQDINDLKTKAFDSIEQFKNKPANKVYYDSLYAYEWSRAEKLKDELAENRVTPQECLEKELNELRQLGYTEDDIKEFRKQGMDIIERQGDNPKVAKQLISVEFAYPKENAQRIKKEMSEDRVTPEQHLERELDELRQLGYTEEDIKEFRKQGMDIIERQGDNPKVAKQLISAEFAYSKEHVDDIKNSKSEARVSVSQRRNELIQKLKDAGFGENKIDSIVEEIDKTIEEGNSKGRQDKVIKSLIEATVNAQISLLEEHKKQLQARLESMEANNRYQNYDSIYGDGTSTKIIDSEKKYEVTKFDLEQGAKKFDQFNTVCMQLLRDVGYGDIQVKEVSDLIKSSSKEKYTDIIRKVDQEVNSLIHQNLDYVDLFFKYPEMLILPTNVYYDGDEKADVNEFIQEYLSRGPEEKKEFINYMNEKMHVSYMRNRITGKWENLVNYVLSTRDNLTDEQIEYYKSIADGEKNRDSILSSHMFTDTLHMMGLREFVDDLIGNKKR